MHALMHPVVLGVPGSIRSGWLLSSIYQRLS